MKQAVYTSGPRSYDGSDGSKWASMMELVNLLPISIVLYGCNGTTCDCCICNTNTQRCCPVCGSEISYKQSYKTILCSCGTAIALCDSRVQGYAVPLDSQLDDVI